jgi:Cu(I)/Ag(I) efflux system membrane fusion protein
VIWESDKARVIIALEEGKFQPRSVTTGVESEGRIEIVSGLNKGEKIVTSAQFLLDSEINMKSALQRMEDSSVLSNHSSSGHAP